MTAYAIVFRETPATDGDAYARYSAGNRDNGAHYRAAFGFKPLAAYGAVQALEGNAPDGVVLIEFPSMEKARAWYDSGDYQSVLPDRLQSAQWRVVLVEGLSA